MEQTNTIGFITDTRYGLNAHQLQQRQKLGLVNICTSKQGKSYTRIVTDNVFTLFNLLNVVLAACVLAVGSPTNAAFMGVILCNILISTTQEILSKRTVDKLKLVNVPYALVLREGEERRIPVGELVLDDMVVLKAGMQIGADCRIVEGVVEVNEALLTGESDALCKQPGDVLLSGSFIISGTCKAQINAVGDSCYASRIAGEAKAHRKPHSQLMDAMNAIIKTISFVIVPVGLLLFMKQFFALKLPLQDAVIKTVAAMIGMIPEGLILLTSVALAVGIARLARKKTLVQQLYCIETLARVDTLCLDKTGTITTGELQVSSVVLLDSTLEETESALSEFVAASSDENLTMKALRERFGSSPTWTVQHVIPFSSERKWSGVAYEGQGSYLLGAPEFVLGEAYGIIQQKVDAYGADGYRVLVLAHSASSLENNCFSSDSLRPMALLLLMDSIRPEAAETLDYFAQQGVSIKIISGDNPVTVGAVAKNAGLHHADSQIDMSKITDQAQLEAAAEAYTVFGRVSPQQKRQLIQALKKHGHTVAMTGDGVNDVLALKDADCSIAMASGSDAARQVSNIVLLNSDFSVMPHVVAEGRRVIHNITRTASLFLTKTLFSAMLALLMLFLSGSYPFEPIQLTLFSSLAIGFPSFVLALEPDTRRVQGRFLKQVLSRALPPSLTIAIGVMVIITVGQQKGFAMAEESTVAILYTVFVGLCSLIRLCRPFNRLRVALVCACVSGFLLAISFMPGFFRIASLQSNHLYLLMGMAMGGITLFYCLSLLMRKLSFSDK